MSESPGAPSGRRADVTQYEHDGSSSSYPTPSHDGSTPGNSDRSARPILVAPPWAHQDADPSKWLRGAQHYQCFDDPLGGTSLGELTRRALHRVE
jgi:hypothetical protein